MIAVGYSLWDVNVITAALRSEKDLTLSHKEAEDF
jgi:hypothetical protein